MQSFSRSDFSWSSILISHAHSTNTNTDHIGQAKELGVEKFDAIVTIDGVDARGWSFKSITNVIKEKTGQFRVEFARATPAAAAERAAKEAAEAEAAASASQPKKS